MLRSRNLWLGAICLAIAPVLLMDLPKHFLDWKDEVVNQTFIVTHNYTYNFTQQQKTRILDHISDRSTSLLISIVWKILLTSLCLGLSIYFFRRFKDTYIRTNLWKLILTTISLCLLFIGIKFTYTTSFEVSKGVTFINLPKDDSNLILLYNRKFKGKVVYVDFWGTTCPSCLEEFTYFTPPLRKQFKDNSKVIFLYICQGQKYLWRQQIKQYNLQGYHAFVDIDQYKKLYRNAIHNNNAQILMPRYALIDKFGRFIIDRVNEPNSTDTLYRQIKFYTQVIK